MIVYLAHNYGGKEENIIESMMFASEIEKEFPDFVIINPLLVFANRKYQGSDKGWFEDITRCLKLLAKCEALILSGDWRHSPGCCAELGYAAALNLPTMFYTKEHKLEIPDNLDLFLRDITAPENKRTCGHKSTGIGKGSH